VESHNSVASTNRWGAVLRERSGRRLKFCPKDFKDLENKETGERLASVTKRCAL
jgi:hypothetical protein